MTVWYAGQNETLDSFCSAYQTVIYIEWQIPSVT